MKVVVYSTGSSYGMIRNVKYFSAIPTMNEQWQRIRRHYEGYEFIIVTTKGYAAHLVDYDEDKQEIAPEGVKLVCLDPSSDTDAYVEAIRKQAPSIAIAASYFGGAVDWETLKDALIAEELRQTGIRAVSNSLYAAETFFDKWNTHKVLTEKGFPVAKATHIPAVYQKLANENPALFSNVYLDLAFHRIRQMEFPVIVKPAGASGSGGVFVAADFEKAKENILSRDDATDLIVEEMLKGEQFGTEIHGTKGNYTILPPFKFNLNAEGIIETREKIKYGPITDEKYRIDELRSMLRRLAEEMGIEGCAQVDLAFDGNLEPAARGTEHRNLRAHPVGADRLVLGSGALPHDHVLAAVVFDVGFFPGGLRFGYLVGGQVCVPDVAFAPRGGDIVEGRAVGQHRDLRAFGQFAKALEGRGRAFVQHGVVLADVRGIAGAGGQVLRLHIDLSAAGTEADPGPAVLALPLDGHGKVPPVAVHDLGVI